MATYKYLVFYHFDGPNHRFPLRTEKRVEEIAWALDEFPHTLGHMLDDEAPGVEMEQLSGDSNARVATVVTASDSNTVRNAAARALDSLDLYGKELAAGRPAWLVILSNGHKVNERAILVSSDAANEYAAEKRGEGYQVSIVPIP